MLTERPTPCAAVPPFSPAVPHPLSTVPTRAQRADEDKLNVARAIERAKANKLIDGSGATCKELERILVADRKAIRFEKEKVAAMKDTNADPADIEVVADAQKAIEKQVEKLAGLQASKGCN